MSSMVMTTTRSMNGHQTRRGVYTYTSDLRHFGPKIKRCFECRHCVNKYRPTLYSLL